VEIVYTLDNVDAIFETLREKIVNLAAYWERFRLSLPGRITIAKTFLISQLNYLGCFLKPSQRIISDIQVILDNFVKKNLNIASDRISQPTDSGGLGMLNISDFLASQRCMWIARAHNFPIDNWRFDLKCLAPSNNILLLRTGDVDKNCHPILYNLVEDYSDFYGKFTAVNSNYKSAFIFDNQSIKCTPNLTHTINCSTFGRAFYNRYKTQIRNLTFDNCFSQAGFKSVAEFAAAGLPLTVAAWMTLRGTLLRAKALLMKNNVFPHTLNVEIGNFVSRKIKGSRMYRNILTLARPQVNIKELRPVVTFSRLIDLPVPSENVVKKTLVSWTHNCCGNRIREFIFKFRYNYLDLNNRINAYLPEVDPRCTFCRIRDPETQIRDSLSHFFYDCPTTSNIVGGILRKYFPANNDPEEISQLYWYGIDNTGCYQSINLLIFDTLRYALYKFKKQRKVPNFIVVEKDFLFLLRTTIMTQKNYREIIENCTPYERISEALG
jgi:hypothetical protein